jgi:hypothetical protein
LIQKERGGQQLQLERRAGLRRVSVDDLGSSQRLTKITELLLGIANNAAISS